MPANQINTLLRFVNLQIAAEAIYGFDPRPLNGVPIVLVPGATASGREITAAELRDGNKRSSLFPDVVSNEFGQQYQLLEHISNTETGFSGTLFRYKGPDDESSGLKTGDKILSFRSTEFVDDAVRENQATNIGEIQKKGWAFGQIADERRDEMIEQRQQRTESVLDAAVGRDVVAVCVPRSRRGVIAQVDRHERDTRLD